MKIMTICGTRPDIIRLSQVINKLDKVCEHILVFTNQSFSENMSEVFFTELGIRKPDYILDTLGKTFGHTLGQILWQTERVLKGYKLDSEPLSPDKVLVLGDTNSALAALMVKRMGFPVYHMEAGNRCYDDIVPEEINRRILDHCVDVHLPYTERGRLNLIAEGISVGKIFVIGNPIFEVLLKNIEDTSIKGDLNVGAGEYYLVTAHREENVDNHERLFNIIEVCKKLAEDKPVIFSRHPRTKRLMNEGHTDTLYPNITFHEPFGLKDFLTLERGAACIITDSGTVQEEACILRIRCVTIRATTERQETVESGSNIVCGLETQDIINAVRLVEGRETDWEMPDGYSSFKVSDKVVNILMGAKI